MVRKPKLKGVGRDYDQTNQQYRFQSGAEIIQSYLNGTTPTWHSRWDQRDRPIPLLDVIPASAPYPEGMNKRDKYSFWVRKTLQNLTDEDKAFLRWVIRKGRVPDAPTKDPGL
jgi:hypothetical protein